MKSVAESKKSENIAEYIVYMYQMEDLIRSYQGNMTEINEFVVKKYPVDEAEKKEIFSWFLNLVGQMEDQGIMKKGHLNSLNELVEKLATIHWDMLKKDSGYFKIYNSAKPHIIQSVMEAEGQNLGNEIQICLNGVYGLLLCRLLGKKVTDEQLESAKAFGEVLSMLSYYYRVGDSLPEN
ncbi:DUF4924 family protein [Algoriphagus sediminis]|uniref:DUF4924 family protein n=1 Tax=Algoriphagus sediminis TaxID=3057113 RepID=A0ABT7Y9J1_9BACT|nr:DUF4924 family protein [Algoriphagus sediminis]MDN3203178.1 DUF4924 family protein [Algoriphagus sediminis]